MMRTHSPSEHSSETTDQSAGTQFICNGRSVAYGGSRTQRLSWVLREHLRQKDVKIGCNAGDCGACTVLLEGKPVCACLTAVTQVRGKRVDTVQGLVGNDALMQALQRSFIKHGAAQCGICTPGMLVSAVSLLRQVSKPTEALVQEALGGVLCRCTGYRKIIKAVMFATESFEEPSKAPLMESTVVASDFVASVGVALPRVDGEPKVSGSEQFGDDVASEGALLCRVLRSPFHHASFEFGDVERFVDQHAGVECVLSAVDIPGLNAFGVIPPFIDQPVFAIKTTRFKGEVVAAVLGEASALEALNLDSFPVRWTELPALLDSQAAMENGACQLHEHAPENVLCEGLVQCGNAVSRLESAYKRVSACFSTGFVEHAYIEPEAGFARRVGDTVEIYGCTQAPYMNRDSLALIMNLDPTSVRIVPTAVGGGFGSKLDLSYQPYVALGAWKTGRDVRMAFSRQESMQSSTKRHPSQIEIEVGVDDSGRLCGFRFDGIFNTGAYASWGPTVANRVPVHASGPYYIADYRAHTTGVFTHSAPAGAFRGFGVPQAAIAQESVFDELANALNMDRLEFRQLNALDNHQRTVTGQTFATSVGIKACLEVLKKPWWTALADATDFNHIAAAQGSSLRRGVGIASGWYGCGNTSLPNPSTIKAGIRADGRVCLHQGAVDIGQGANTVVTQIFADTLGVPVSAIDLIGADSALTPDAGKTSASRQTFVSGNAARLTALALREVIARHSHGEEIVQLHIEQGGVIINRGTEHAAIIELSTLSENEQGYVMMAEESYDPPTSPLNEQGQGEPYSLYGYAAQMLSLDVDTELGTVKLQRITAAHDVGRAINPLLVEGQIEGGIAQGIGLALMEEFIPGRTENLHDYLIPTIGDVPAIDTHIVEVKDPHGPFGAKGLGEHVLIPTAPAILNAIAHASGARIRHLPATPEKILNAIKTRGGLVSSW